VARKHSLSAVRGIAVAALIGLLMVSTLFAQQISIPRIDQMPDKPTPYVMRNWKQVALGYDSLVFNLNLSGQYLPLIRLNSSTVNYPGQTSFGLQSYVGSAIGSGEGINCIPAVVSASLVGIDKSNQNGRNWVLMCEEWFNKKNGQNVYLNSPNAQTGDDWWYETMPNIFFYQLYSMYPATGEFPIQFKNVADRWLAVVKAMGGSSTPWGLANVNHRAFNLITMTPNDAGVKEPEAAGAIAWLLYNAFVKTGIQQYRIGAELAMESLLANLSNPSYELQLPYGTYIATRMNAELGTTYDVTKMMNWCFSDGKGTLRQWGAIVGTWGGYDCSGLIGEVNYSNDYPFFMNSVEQVGALVPLVRYDDRFGRAIGKWVLNVANAARLFYTNYLPDDHQDGQQWAHQYDPNSCFAHEAMRQYNPSNWSISPYATGDAIRGGWAPTNFALYGSSHLGILGGIIDTSSVPMILRVDLLETDYFHDTAYPTYLYYNPYGVDTSVAIDVGAGSHDLYNTVTKTFLRRGVSGSTTFSIPSNSAVVVVVTPGGGTMTYDLDKILIDGVVIDYRSGLAIGNYPPRVKSLTPDSTTLLTGRTVHIYCTATDRDNDALSYFWNASSGAISGSGSVVTWNAPDSVGMCTVTCVVNDGRGGQTSAVDTFEVVRSINHPPVISRFTAKPRKIGLGATSSLTCLAIDPDSNALTYSWAASYGRLSGTGSSVSWTAPSSAGNYYVSCTVDDGHGGQAVDSIGLEVRDLSIVLTGTLVAYYPFNGNANDASGNNHNGVVNGAQLVSDRFGYPNSAYYFDGATASIQVPNDAALNFQNSITVNFWMKVHSFYSREQYPISHGNWTNRWKFSITPTTNRIRWTVKSALSTVKDLDSETQLMVDSLYNITGVYDGSDFEIYINGQLSAFSSFSGLINPTSYGVSIGQDLPTDNNYGFNGVLDDIRIYNYALPYQEIVRLCDISTSVKAPSQATGHNELALEQNFPNPFNPSTIIRFSIPDAAKRTFVSLRIYDALGREVATLVNKEMERGQYDVPWNAGSLSSGIYFCKFQSDRVTFIRKMLLMK
jgi:hypothetical protein